MTTPVPAYIRAHGPMEIALRISCLANEIETLKDEEEWRTGKKVARTLVKDGELRVVLILMRRGARLEPHRAAGAVTIHCVRGRVDLTALGECIELVPGEIAALDGGVEHGLDAQRESVILLTLAQPAGAA